MGNKKNKQRRRREFESRHVDQLWRDVRKPPTDVVSGTTGPIGTTDKYRRNARARSSRSRVQSQTGRRHPGQRQTLLHPLRVLLQSIQCLFITDPLDAVLDRRYFTDGESLSRHETSKLHKKRVKLLRHGIPPHDSAAAGEAAGKGPVDNGPRLRPHRTVTPSTHLTAT